LRKDRTMRFGRLKIFIVLLPAALSACGPSQVVASFDLSIVIVFLFAVLSACATLLVPETSDPHRKLDQAVLLFHSQARPLRAERLIREAIGIFRKNNDQLGLASAYQTYGFFFRSHSIEKWRNTFTKEGFLDKKAAYHSRLVNSIEYFDKAKTIFRELNHYDGLTNVNYNMGVTYEYMNNRLLACQAYEQSLENYRKSFLQNPDANVVVPGGFSNYEEAVASHKKRMGCAE